MSHELLVVDSVRKGANFTMTLQQINQKIAVANAESKRLNNERQVLIGKRQALEKQLSDAIAAYEKAYGVKLSPETIDTEVERVSAMKEAEVSNIETMLGLIRENRFEEAERIAMQDSVNEADQMTQEPVQTFAADQTGVEEAGVVPPMYAPPVEVNQTPTSVPMGFSQQHPVAPPMMPPVSQPVMPPPPVAQPVAPPQRASTVSAPQRTPGLSGLPIDETMDDTRPAPPPTFSRPTPPAQPPKIGVPPAMGTSSASGLSFNAVLSGQAFDPQGGK